MGYPARFDETVILIENPAIKDLCIGAHFHDWLEFSLLVEGEQEVTVDSNTYITSSGDFIMYGYNQVHSIYSRKDSRKVTFQFKKEYLQRVVPMFHSSKVYCNSAQILDVESYYKYNELKYFYLHMAEAFKSDTPAGQMRFMGYLFLFFSYLSEHFEVEQNRTALNPAATNNPLIPQLLNYIHKHYNEELTLNQLSEVFYLAPDYISRTMKEELGMGFKDYLVQVRLNHACFEILHSDKSLLMVAEESGFPSNKSFIAAFKENYHMTPLKYRKLNSPKYSDS